MLTGPPCPRAEAPWPAEESCSVWTGQEMSAGRVGASRGPAGATPSWPAPLPALPCHGVHPAHRLPGPCAHTLLYGAAARSAPLHTALFPLCSPCFRSHLALTRLWPAAVAKSIQRVLSLCSPGPLDHAVVTHVLRTPCPGLRRHLRQAGPHRVDGSSSGEALPAAVTPVSGPRLARLSQLLG